MKRTFLCLELWTSIAYAIYHTKYNQAGKKFDNFVQFLSEKDRASAYTNLPNLVQTKKRWTLTNFAERFFFMAGILYS